MSLKGYKVDRPSKKLANQKAGPFPVVEKVGHSYRLELPASMKIHPIFSPDKLRRAATDPLPGQTTEPPEPITINDEQEWELEEVLASRIYRRRLQYRVKWLGYDDDSTWYYARNFKGSPHRLRDYHKAHPDQPGPPKHLDEWLTAWEDGVEDIPDARDDDDPVED